MPWRTLATFSIDITLTHRFLHFHLICMNLGDGLAYHNGSRFSTIDKDNDCNCADICRGGWWFRCCVQVHLNGEYITPGTVHDSDGRAGVVYYILNQFKSLKTAKMMFRRKQ